MKKCPYCFTELDDRASICSGCRKRVFKIGDNGVAKKHSGCLVPVILIIAITMFGGLFLTLPKQSTTIDDVAYKKSVENSLKKIRARQKEANTKVAVGQTRTFTLAEKKKICDHTTIADDISGLIGRSLEKGRKLVIKHFNITPEQFKQINVEGLEKVWSLPPQSARNNPEYKYLYGHYNAKNTVKKETAISFSFEEAVSHIRNRKICSITKTTLINDETGLILGKQRHLMPIWYYKKGSLFSVNLASQELTPDIPTTQEIDEIRAFWLLEPVQ